jgi:septal ring factor EnvC (AmiA/AmiB activator)
MKYLLIFFSLIFLAGAAGAQTSAELKRRREALTREIEQLNNSLNQTSSNRKLSLKQVNMLNAKIRLREKKINVINAEMHDLDNEISNNTNTVAALQTQLDRLRKEYAEMVFFAYRNRSAYSKLMFLFAAKDFNQGFRRLKYLQQFGQYRQKQAQYILSTNKELHLRIEELGHNREEKSHLLSDQEKERKNLGRERSDQSKILTNLTKQEKEFKKELDQKQRDAQLLSRMVQAAIQKEIADEQRAAGGAVSRTSNASAVLAATPESAKLSSDFLGSRGSLPWPVTNGIVVEQFGEHTYGVNVKVENNGIDIKTPAGSTVRAVFSGTVGRIAPVSGSYTVLVRHGEYFSVYSNLKSVSVSSGQKISTKQAVGTVATNSDDGTTQLHFEIYKGQSPQNPESWLTPN